MDLLFPDPEPVRKAAPSTMPAGYVGMRYCAGEVVVTATGRETSVYPMPSTGGLHGFATDAGGWLQSNAISEADYRGDFHLAEVFRKYSREDLIPTLRALGDMEEYLFACPPAAWLDGWRFAEVAFDGTSRAVVRHELIGRLSRDQMRELLCSGVCISNGSRFTCCLQSR